ncbi:hypothetical protein A3A46_00435 [Candidatus Roizmanbacteria bacterium RIFCSPLOWO2_01_FULL_37_13]|uniref:Acyltransferase 3 domain-containing protein n=1 Tax=Candidatus Roizmanbacteria bacterium RIFCSPHIGHO2_02_FULL_38_11 TaxID=1802039 RepID=A0A1F7GZF4_9BACT|nr:MAG: hypothetical protein A3C25_00195 [Candidatus Roizmanbacteria bacterium RIFCSPHIGHO2_02_FULL_38_11]OGK34753.1 MAG: hypothetical protein A3F58_04195 [Candidatus Roizmanbacteria bacterium RIFCSPHIGHO2_12_FULL_37_9b]OGK41725.1 MAG: hypothetical protein A3A46_00435 [Candidatus Roizmanbacteria bacterium RIFCSPLOWO2_01_FULL_37_13]
MKNYRYDHIDFLRTVAIIVIIITHALSYYLSDRLIFTIWNYLHFVVIGLVFCSGYVLTAKYKNAFSGFSSTMSWYWKRLVRLLIPFYLYLVAHYSLWYLFPRYFDGLGLKKSPEFIIQSILLIGGIDFNWFPFLFIQLTILFPLIIRSLRKKLLLLLFISFSLASTFYFTLTSFQGGGYRYVMWASWINIIFLSIFIHSKEKKGNSLPTIIKRYLIIGSMAFIFFFLTVRFTNSTFSELVLTRHKYPPDAIYLTYGIAITCFMLIVSRIDVLYRGFLRRIFQYISQRSYQLFFIHYIALDFIFKISKGLSFWSIPAVRTILVILLSLGITYFISIIAKIKNGGFRIHKLVLIFLGFILVWFLIKNLHGCLIIDKNPVARSSVLEWIQKPAAIRFVGKHDRTYISWIGNRGKVQMRFYDHKNKTFSEIYTVDDLYPDYGIEAQDDHNAPSLLILPDGQLLIFYVVHDVNGAFFMKTSVGAEDIFSWSERKRINDPDAHTTYNYPQAKRLNNGNIVLFYRRGVYYNSDEYFKISSDGGQNWGDPIKLIDFADDGVYAFVYTSGNQIHVAWNKAVSIPPKENVYYTYSDDGGVNWKKREGTDLMLPITEVNADLVFDSGDKPDFVWDIVVDEGYNPFIVFAYKDDPYHEFRFARWNGSSWVMSSITSSSMLYDSGNFFSGGIVIDPNNVYKVYLSKKRAKLEIESWISSDFGETWKKSESITQNSLVDNFRPQVVQNYAENFRLVWSSGIYEGLINSQWSGFEKVNIQSELTKAYIPSSCNFLAGSWLWLIH